MPLVAGVLITNSVVLLAFTGNFMADEAQFYVQTALKAAASKVRVSLSWSHASWKCSGKNTNTEKLSERLSCNLLCATRIFCLEMLIELRFEKSQLLTIKWSGDRELKGSTTLFPDILKP